MSQVSTWSSEWARRGRRSQDAWCSFSDSGWPRRGICSSRTASRSDSSKTSSSCSMYWSPRTSLIVPWSCFSAWSVSVPLKHTWAHRVKWWSSAMAPNTSAKSTVSRSSHLVEYQEHARVPRVANFQVSWGNYRGKQDLHCSTWDQLLVLTISECVACLQWWSLCRSCTRFVTHTIGFSLITCGDVCSDT